MPLAPPRRRRSIASFALALPLAVAGLGCGARSEGIKESERPRPRPATRPATIPVPKTAPVIDVPTTVIVTTQIASTDWKALFDGKTLTGWKVSEFGGHGEPEVADGAIALPHGEGLTGVAYAGGVKLPTVNYEVSLEAKRVEGSDFFCGLTFPVKDSFATLVLGGWGGTVVGISSINGDDASNNETTSNRRFEAGRWYRVRVRVLPNRLQAWIDDERVVDVSTDEKKLDIRPDVEESKPLGVASWRTTAAVREVKVRELAAGER